eukprot:SAG31_NODE_17131_length_682_cov_0.969125_1_plen_87_part_00
MVRGFKKNRFGANEFLVEFGGSGKVELVKLKQAPGWQVAVGPLAALWKAADAGDAAEVAKLLAAGADMDEVRHALCGCSPERQAEG